MFGLINLNKPASLTSRDAVNHIQRLVRPHKVGHAGTLDPLATGVLVIAIGPATRLVEYVQRFPKRYRGRFVLGRTSDTEDVEGSVEELPEAPRPTRAQIEEALGKFVGTIRQIPPAYSALRIGGRRAYELARAGQRVSLESRDVVIHSLRLVDYEYPHLELDIECGSGTYIRSLGRDLALELQTGAVMSALVRTAIGHFRLDDACALDSLTRETLGGFLRPAIEAVKNWPRRLVSPAELRQLGNGRPIPKDGVVGCEIAACDALGRLVALLEARGDWLQPVRTFMAGMSDEASDRRRIAEKPASAAAGQAGPIDVVRQPDAE